jgi:hypothetical protein
MIFVAQAFQRLGFFSTASTVAGIAVAMVFKTSLLNVALPLPRAKIMAPTMDASATIACVRR